MSSAFYLNWRHYLSNYETQHRSFVFFSLVTILSKKSFFFANQVLHGLLLASLANKNYFEPSQGL